MTGVQTCALPISNDLPLFEGFFNFFISKNTRRPPSYDNAYPSYDGLPPLRDATPLREGVFFWTTLPLFVRGFIFGRRYPSSWGGFFLDDATPLREGFLIFWQCYPSSWGVFSFVDTTPLREGRCTLLVWHYPFGTMLPYPLCTMLPLLDDATLLGWRYPSCYPHATPLREGWFFFLDDTTLFGRRYPSGSPFFLNFTTFLFYFNFFMYSF